MRYSSSFVAGALSVTAVSVVWHFIPTNMHPVNSVLAILGSAVVVFVGAAVSHKLKTKEKTHGQEK